MGQYSPPAAIPQRLPPILRLRDQHTSYSKSAAISPSRSPEGAAERTAYRGRFSFSPKIKAIARHQPAPAERVVAHKSEWARFHAREGWRKLPMAIAVPIVMANSRP